MTGRGALCGVVALVAGLCMAAAAHAQAFFYREEARDGRIYVFAQTSAYQNWIKANGEMGKSTSRIGYGPNGETVVFDSDDAINLYNYKHDKAGEVFAKPAEPPKPAAEPVAKLGGTIFSEYVFTHDPAEKDASGNTIRKTAFEVRRAYINVTGNISDILSYRVTPDVAARQATASSNLPAGASVSSNLDGSLTYRLKYAYGQMSFDRWMRTKGSWLRLGQQQTPYVDFIEGVYRYRFEGTVFVDRESFLSSSDVGISGRWVAPREYGDLHLGIYNGETYSKPEANDQKAIQLRASLRPLPRSAELKGLRLTGFIDRDRPLRGGKRNRAVGALTFEHRFVNAGFEFLRTRDRANGSAAIIDADGYSGWITPRTKFGLEGLLRYDSLRPNRNSPASNDARRSRTLVGAAYWFKAAGKSPLAAAVLAEYEHVKYDSSFNKVDENRYALKSLLAF